MVHQSRQPDYYQSAEPSSQSGLSISMNATTPRAVPPQAPGADQSYFSIQTSDSQAPHAGHSLDNTTAAESLQVPLKPLSLRAHSSGLPYRSQSSQSLRALNRTSPHRDQSAPLLQRRQVPTGLSSSSSHTLLNPQRPTGSSPHTPSTSRLRQWHPAYDTDSHSSAKMFQALDKMEQWPSESRHHDFHLSSPAVSAFPASDDWQTICIRLLPLFNGEFIKGSIEEVGAVFFLWSRTARRTFI